MKTAKTTKTGFSSFVLSLSEADRERIKVFFSDFDLYFPLPKNERKKFKADFEAGIMRLVERGASVETAVSRLALSRLGGFYARPSVAWFPLDDAAKIYPISMEHGSQQLFRMSVYFKEDVVAELLQIALTFTMNRFPSFATTLKKGIFWHYLDAVKKRFTVEEEHDVPCQPIKVSLSGSNSFRLLYYKNRMSLEIFHAITDGTGASAFLKVLTVEYLRLLGVVTAPTGEICVEDLPSCEEFENAFAKVEKAKAASGFVDKPALQMSGRLTRRKPCRMLHFKMDAETVHAKAKSHGVTVTAYLLSQIFYAVRAATEELSGDVSIELPVNMRKYYPSKTLRNFSMYCGIRVPIEQIGDRETLLSEIKAQITEKSAKEKMREMITATVKLVSSIRLIPLVIKQPIAKLVYGLLGEKISTAAFSNLGVVEMPDTISPYVECMDFCLGPTNLHRVACAAITQGGVLTFSITKMTADPTFEERMYRLLSEDGIAVTVEGSDYYAR